MHFLDEKGAHYDNGMKKSMKGRVPKTIEQFEWLSKSYMDKVNAELAQITDKKS